MTPALSLAFLPASGSSPPALPITWHGRLVFTEEHVVTILESLRFGGISRDRAANGALRLRNGIDAGKALRHACDACPALAREVDAAEAEGRARLRVDGVSRAGEFSRGAERGIGDAEGLPDGAQANTAVVGGDRDETKHEGGEQVHAQHGATAAPLAQASAVLRGVLAHEPCGESLPLTGAAGMRLGSGEASATDDAEQKRGDGAHVTQGEAGTARAQGKDEGPGALQAPEPSPGISPSARGVAGAIQPVLSVHVARDWDPSPRAAQPTSAPIVAQAPVTWNEVTTRSAALDVEAVLPAVEAARSKRASEATDDGAPNWERIREEAAGYAPGPYGWVLYQEDHLAHSGENFPALSPFSLYTIERFFLSGKRWLLWMAGRGFGKSTLTARIATALGFGVQRRAAPGPAWVCPIVSVLPVDADRRLEDIQQILMHVYRQEVKPVKSMIAATDGTGCAIAWVSSASTIGNVSGPSSFAALMDEEEKILNGRAGGIVGSLAFTFRSRPRTYGMRVSSAMTTADTLAGDCERGQTLTNYVVTLGPFVDAAVAGLLAVAAWEEAGIATGKANPEAAHAIRSHALSLTADSWQIPTWLGHPTIGIPTDAEGRPLGVPWGPGDAAIATRIEAEAVPEKARDGLPPWRYWLRECCSVPTGDEAWETAGEWAVLGEEHRNAGIMTEERWDGR